MNVEETKLSGVRIIELNVFSDQRGYFTETFQETRYKEIGIDYDFVQDNQSFSQKGVLRGLHFQIKKPQGKLVYCPHGAVYDVVVDIDPFSITFGQHVGVTLSGDNHKQLWVPPGYAHGFCVLSESAYFHYKTTDYFDPADEGGLIWNDPMLDIDWPVDKPKLSNKDAALPALAALQARNL